MESTKYSLDSGGGDPGSILGVVEEDHNVAVSIEIEAKCSHLRECEGGSITVMGTSGNLV